ncbi:MAG TPA: galactose oxidase-like domain-containing protein [Planctomycetota bacterium]|nr:galactose oxidase-like domain-containing protein [Planctomycetota bacterium]
MHGRWLGPWVFHSTDYDLQTQQCIPNSDVCIGIDPCSAGGGGKVIAHAMLLPTGDHAGDVLLMDEAGRTTRWNESNPTWIDASIFCSPYPGPSSTAQWGTCTYDIFCSGHTAHSDGRLVIAGGGIFTSVLGAPGTVFFDPTITDGSVDPWEPGPDMSTHRYYPTAVSMLKAFDGYPFIMGGTVYTNQGPPTSAIREWERLVPLQPSGTNPCVATPVDWIAETLMASDTTQFEYYPRVHQLSGPTGEFFISGDTQPALVELCAGSGNAVGETWFLQPPLTGSSTGVLGSGPSDTLGGVPRNRYYGTSVLLHQRPENGGTDRVLVFCGSDGCDSGDPSCCNGSIMVRSDVKELNCVPGATPGGSSTLVAKAPLLCPRVFSSATILPTGDIFISRGSATDPQNDTVQPLITYEPHAWAEVYRPGPTKTAGSGSSSYTAAVPDSFANWCPAAVYNKRPPRIYHHISLLLPSGRVLVAGGDEVPLDPASPQCGQFGTSSYSGEVYEPAYMHQGWSVEITQAPSTALFRRPIDVSFKITGASAAAVPDRVVFIRTGSITHHQDSSQIYIELAYSIQVISTQGSTVIGTVRATAPGPSFGPPGYYVLFVVGNDGGVRVPSAGKFVKLE